MTILRKLGLPGLATLLLVVSQSLSCGNRLLAVWAIVDESIWEVLALYVVLHRVLGSVSEAVADATCLGDLVCPQHYVSLQIVRAGQVT